MAATTKPRRKRKATSKNLPVVGATRYHILDQAGHDVAPEQGHPGVALSRALNIIQRMGVDGDETPLYVERRTLFGNPVELYRIIRDEDGVIRTYTINLED